MSREKQVYREGHHMKAEGGTFGEEGPPREDASGECEKEESEQTHTYENA